MDKQATYDDISEVIKEQVDNFRFRRPCIIDGHEALISKTESKIISFDQSVNDFIIEQINDSESHDFIRDLTEFGMAAGHVTFDNHRGIHIQHISPYGMCCAAMPAVIGGLKHDIATIDDEYKPKYADPALEHEKQFLIAGIPYRKRSYASKNTMELVDAILFQEEKQPKENHQHGWYRKFEKKRF